jgi:hypothetical protein
MLLCTKKLPASSVSCKPTPASPYHALQGTTISPEFVQILAIHLLHEASKGAASFWHPYLQQLPRHFTTLMAWPQQAQQQLQLPHAQQAAAAAVDTARSEWLAARAALQELGEGRCVFSWSVVLLCCFAH